MVDLEIGEKGKVLIAFLKILNLVKRNYAFLHVVVYEIDLISVICTGTYRSLLLICTIV